jgi:hypothetical protein
VCIEPEREIKVKIGAILTLTATHGKEADSSESGKDAARKRRRFLSNTPDVKLDVLGKSLLDRTIEKLEAAGVEATTVIPEGPAGTQLLSTRSLLSDDFISAWERAVAEWVQQGVGSLLLVSTGGYSDLDFEELLRFHGDRGAALTQAYAADGSLDMAVVNANFLRDVNGAYRKTLSGLISDQERFFYRGYVNRLRKPQDFRRLTEDALSGKCDLRPVGTEVGPGIWFGSGAEVDESCAIDSPAFVGAGTRIAACCSISGGSAIERDCEIDYGTTVEQSWILQETYVGLGLNVRRSVVSNQKMFHLDRKTEIAISDPRLIRATKSLPFARAGAALLSKLQIAN